MPDGLVVLSCSRFRHCSFPRLLGRYPKRRGGRINDEATNLGANAMIGRSSSGRDTTRRVIPRTPSILKDFWSGTQWRTFPSNRVASDGKKTDRTHASTHTPRVVVVSFIFLSASRGSATDRGEPPFPNRPFVQLIQPRPLSILAVRPPARRTHQPNGTETQHATGRDGTRRSTS